MPYEELQIVSGDTVHPELPLMQVDDKWSIAFDPDNNDHPEYWFRYGERHSPFIEDNAVTAMFYALREATQNQI